MNIEYIYENRHIIPKESAQHFIENRKCKLTPVEKFGLEYILCEFVKQAEIEEFDKSYTDLREWTVMSADNVSILDGDTNTHIFENFAIEEIWIAYDSCVMLTCYKLEHPDYDDPYEIEQHVDFRSECEEVIFRLD